MVTVTTAGKSTQTYQIDTTVDPLPERVQDTFFGGSTNAPFVGSANVTVAASGKETGRFPLVVTPDGLAKSEGGIALGWGNWKVEPWKTLGKSFDKRVFTYAIKADGSFSSSDADVASPLGDAFVGKVMLTFAANGTAKIAGELVTGYDARKSKFTTVKVTGLDQRHEVDFALVRLGRITQLIQVSYVLESPKTRERELSALFEVGAKLGCPDLLLVTDHETGEERRCGQVVRIVDAPSWLLSTPPMKASASTGRTKVTTTANEVKWYLRRPFAFSNPKCYTAHDFWFVLGSASTVTITLPTGSC